MPMATGSEPSFLFSRENAVGGLHARRAGWFSAQQLGAWMLAEAKPPASS